MAVVAMDGAEPHEQALGQQACRRQPPRVVIVGASLALRPRERCDGNAGNRSDRSAKSPHLSAASISGSDRRSSCRRR